MATSEFFAWHLPQVLHHGLPVSVSPYLEDRRGRHEQGEAGNAAHIGVAGNCAGSGFITSSNALARVQYSKFKLAPLRVSRAAETGSQSLTTRMEEGCGRGKWWSRSESKPAIRKPVNFCQGESS